MKNRLKTYSTKFKIAGLITAIFVLTGACQNTDSSDEKRTLRIVYTDWSESVAITHLTSVLLEEKMEYNVILKLTDVESAYAEVATKNSNVFLDAWLPETHKRYYEEHSDAIEQIGITYPEARTGLVVPDYSRIQSIPDLQTYAKSIIGIDPGAGVMIKTRQAIERYNLNLILMELSEQEMVQQLEDSIKRRKEIVITGWEPHWIFARYQLRFLEDPDNIFGQREKIYTVANKNIEQEHPQAVRFFERMQLTENQLNQLIYFVRLNEDPRAGVKQWIKQNEYVVNQWVKNLKPKRKKIM